MRRSAVLTMVCAVLFAGCSLYRVDSKNVSSDFYPPKDSVDQVVYLEKVEKPCDVIGIVKVTAEGENSREEVISKMRHEGEMLGADAITDISSEHDSFHVRYTAKAVVYK